MNYQDIKEAREEAQASLACAHQAVRHAIDLCADHLRVSIPKPGVWSDERTALSALKRELRDFNIVTGRWKEPS